MVDLREQRSDLLLLALVQRDYLQRLLADLVLHDELADLSLQALDLGTVLGLKSPLVDLERLDPAAMELFGPFPELRLRQAVLAADLRNGDRTFENLQDHGHLTLGRPALELVVVGFRPVLAGLVSSSGTLLSLIGCPAPDGVTSRVFGPRRPPRPTHPSSRRANSRRKNWDRRGPSVDTAGRPCYPSAPRINRLTL